MYVSLPFRILNYFRIFTKFFKRFAIGGQPQNLYFYYEQPLVRVFSDLTSSTCEILERVKIGNNYFYILK